MTRIGCPFFSYFGGKFRAARHYPVPRFPVVLEPFAGAAGYATFHMSRTQKTVLLDADPTVAGIWEYLIGAREYDILSLPDVAIGGGIDKMPAGPAQDFVGFWLNQASTGGGRQRTSYSNWGAATRAKIAAQLQFIRKWEIHNKPYWEAPDIEATWFIDPPYQREGHAYKHSSKALDFERLGDWCRARRGQVIVCEGVGANWLPFKKLRDMKSAQHDRVSTEYIWTNER